MKIFSSICKVSDCVDYNVALIEDLDKNRMPMPDTSGKLTRLRNRVVQFCNCALSRQQL